MRHWADGPSPASPVRRPDAAGLLPDAEEPPGQQRMAELVAAAIDTGRHLVVQAGTGTGKTLAYLVPAIASGPAGRRRHGHQGAAGPARRQGPARSSPTPCRRAFDWAVLKGAATTSACSASAR